MTNSYRTIRRGAVAVSLLAIGSAAAPAALAQNDEFTFRFAYDEARLQSDGEARQVYGELVQEAHEACRMRAPSAQRHVNSSCKADIVNSVVEGIGSDRLQRIQQASPVSPAPIQTASR